MSIETWAVKLAIHDLKQNHEAEIKEHIRFLEKYLMLISNLDRSDWASGKLEARDNLIRNVLQSKYGIDIDEYEEGQLREIR